MTITAPKTNTSVAALPKEIQVTAVLGTHLNPSWRGNQGEVSASSEESFASLLWADDTDSCDGIRYYESTQRKGIRNFAADRVGVTGKELQSGVYWEGGWVSVDFDSMLDELPISDATYDAIMANLGSYELDANGTLVLCK